MKSLLIIGIFGLLLASMVSADYDEYEDDGEGSENTAEIEDSEDSSDRETRQTPRIAMAPSRSCARVYLARSWCGGMSSGNGGACDVYCRRQGYSYSWCRPSYCLCHRGQDRGRECEIL